MSGTTASIAKIQVPFCPLSEYIEFHLCVVFSRLLILRVYVVFLSRIYNCCVFSSFQRWQQQHGLTAVYQALAQTTYKTSSVEEYDAYLEVRWDIHSLLFLLILIFACILTVLCS
jgi:hypothetical protein